MLRRKGQNIAEYVILVAIIIAAAAAMQVYIRRGIQGRMADAVDFAPEAEVLWTSNTTNSTDNMLQFNTKQYEPYYAESAANVTSKMGYKDTLSARGGVDRSGINQTTTRMKDSYEVQKSYTNGSTRE